MGACTLIAKLCIHLSTAIDAISANHVSAALFTRMSIGPNAERASSTTRAHSSGDARSAAIACASAPASRNAATVVSSEPASLR
ncbi:unannotated protein [freshwater metagenome]|uniref:Unannotated protein n=1 Tax=freshwater metagenome TaxID=449393 RepID=A0A6J7RC76_9ZZZZ